MEKKENGRTGIYQGSEEFATKSEVKLSSFFSASAPPPFAVPEKLNVLRIQHKSCALPYLSSTPFRHWKIQNELGSGEVGRRFLKLWLKMWEAPDIESVVGIFPFSDYCGSNRNTTPQHRSSLVSGI